MSEGSARDSEIVTIAGHLLCAVPQLLDPNFHRSIVFMLEHSEEGALGIVLNDPMPTSVADVTRGLGLQWLGDPDDLMRHGGPVEPARGWIFNDQNDWDPDAETIAPGLNLTTSLVHLKAPGGPRFGDGGRFIFVLGYAGWGAAQLEAEIATGSWVLVPIQGVSDDKAGVTIDWLFETDPVLMWDQALRAIGIDPSRLVGMQGRASVLQ